jgi:acetyl esterase/lipase
MLILLLAACSLASAAEPPEIPLWANGAPGSEGLNTQEKLEMVDNGRDRRVSNVINPTIAVYQPAADKATGAALIIAPGGGHRFLSFDSEGHGVAKWAASVGITGVVLKYRLRAAEGASFQVEKHVLADAQRAIRMVRHRAAEWKINPARVGMVGFSAGGEVAALSAVRFDGGVADAPDPVERMNSRPDFVALLYPGLPRITPRATKEMPPMFLCAAHDDRANISEGLAEYYLEVKRLGVPVELHLFTGGGHGFGIKNRPFPITEWPARLRDWMGHLGLLK